MFFLSVCVAEDPENRAREEKKRFRSRQIASKQGTNHSDSYSQRIDLPRSNAVAREAWTFAYVPLHLVHDVKSVALYTLDLNSAFPKQPMRVGNVFSPAPLVSEPQKSDSALAS